MLEKILKKASWSDIIISIGFIVMGILLVSNPDTIVSIIALILGGIFIAMGAFKIIQYVSGGKQDNYLLGIGVVAVIVGIVIMFCTGIILSMFRVIIGIWIIYSGIMNLQTAIVWKDYKSRLWLTTIIGSIIVIIAGIYVIVNTGAILQTIGTIIIVYGIIDIIERIIFIKKVDDYLK